MLTHARVVTQGQAPQLAAVAALDQVSPACLFTTWLWGGGAHWHPSGHTISCLPICRITYMVCSMGPLIHRAGLVCWLWAVQWRFVEVCVEVCVSIHSKAVLCGLRLLWPGVSARQLW